MENNFLRGTSFLDGGGQRGYLPTDVDGCLSSFNAHLWISISSEYRVSQIPLPGRERQDSTLRLPLSRPSSRLFREKRSLDGRMIVATRSPSSGPLFALSLFSVAVSLRACTLSPSCIESRRLDFDAVETTIVYYRAGNVKVSGKLKNRVR